MHPNSGNTSPISIRLHSPWAMTVEQYWHQVKDSIMAVLKLKSSPSPTVSAPVKNQRLSSLLNFEAIENRKGMSSTPTGRP